MDARMTEEGGCMDAGRGWLHGRREREFAWDSRGATEC